MSHTIYMYIHIYIIYLYIYTYTHIYIYIWFIIDMCEMTRDKSFMRLTCLMIYHMCHMTHDLLRAPPPLKQTYMHTQPPQLFGCTAGVDCYCCSNVSLPCSSSSDCSAFGSHRCTHSNTRIIYIYICIFIYIYIYIYIYVYPCSK